MPGRTIFKDNRVVLETMARYAEMVGITERKLEIKEMFAESALADEQMIGNLYPIPARTSLLSSSRTNREGS